MIQTLFRFRLVWLALMLGGVAGAAFQARHLAFDFSPQYLFESDQPEFRTLERLYDNLGRQDNTLLVLVTADDVLAPQVLEYVESLTQKLENLDGIASASGVTRAYHVVSPSFPPVPITSLSGEALRKAVRSQPLLDGRVVSRDDRATLVIVRVERSRMAYEKLRPVVESALETLEKTERPDGVVGRATGVPVARVEIVGDMQADQKRFFWMCGLVFVLLLWALFRDPRAVFVPMFGVSVAVLYTVGALGTAREKIDILNNVLPTLLFVIGLSDAIHLISRYREELAAGRPREVALPNTVRHLAVACFLTSFTTAVGFGSLRVAKMEILQRFGMWAAGGILMTYLVTIVLVPLLFSYLGPIVGTRASRLDRAARRLYLRVGLFVIRRPRWIAAIGLLLIAGAGALGSGVRVTNNLYEAFDPADPVVLTNAELERSFSGVVPLSVVVEWDPGASALDPDVLEYIRELERFIDADHQAGSSLSIADLVAEWQLMTSGTRGIPPTAEQCEAAVHDIATALDLRREGHTLRLLYNGEARMLRIQAWTGDHGAHVLDMLFERIRARLLADAPTHDKLGIRCYLSGDGMVASQSVNRVIEDLFSSLLLAFGVILITMTVLLRSVRTAMVSMVANVFPLVITLGFMRLAGMDLRVTSVLVFTISLGLAVDDTIHFMARFREEWRRRPSYPKAILRTFRGTGHAIVVTTLVLGTGFGVLLTSSFPISRVFALCLEITIIAAMIGDLLLLPALLLVFKPVRTS